jgi:hypothetical protein
MATQITGTVKYTLSTGARGPEGLAGATGPPLNLTAGPVRSTAGTSSIADGALSIAKTSGLQAALGKIIYASTYGASPSATAATNVIAIQAALTAANAAGGGMVIIDQAGDYLVSSLLTIYANTHLKMVPGSALKKSGTARGEVLRNYGATSGVTDENITLEGVRIKCNALSSRDSSISGVICEVLFYRTKNLVIRDFQIRDLTAILFGLQICSWEHLFVENTHFEGDKDGIHLGAGRHGRIVGLRGDTGDDLLAINAHDWAIANPTTGDITDLTIERMDAQGNVRLMTGSWTAWANGQQYYNGERTSNAGKVYTYNSTSGGIRTASVAPTHTSGTVTGADGIPWRYEYTGANITTNLRGIVFRDCRFDTQGILREVNNGNTGEMRGQTPGTEGNDEISGLVFENCIFPGTVLLGRSAVRDVTMRGCQFLAAGATLIAQNPYAVSANFAAARNSTLMVEGCRFHSSTMPVVINGTVPNNWFIKITGLGNSGATDAFMNVAAVRADNFDLPIRVDQVVPTAGDRARLRLASGPTLTGWYVYSRNRWEPETPTMEANYEDRLLMPSYYLPTGTAATAAAADGSLVLNSGSTAGGFAMARLSQKTGWHASGSTNYNIPFVISGNGQIGAKSGGAVRILYGVAVGYNSGFVANAGTSPFTEKGVGIEFAQEGGTGNQKVRIIGYTTVAVESAWFDLGVAPNYINDFQFELYSDGAGTYRLYIPTPASAITNRRPFLPQTASCTLTGGPTGTGATAANTGIWVVATGDNATTPAGSDIYAYLSFPKLRFPRF